LTTDVDFENDFPKSLTAPTASSGDTGSIQCANYLREELPSIFRQLLDDIFQQEVSNLNDRIQSRIVAAVADPQHIAYHRFLRETSDGATSEPVIHRPPNHSVPTEDFNSKNSLRRAKPRQRGPRNGTPNF
jgi:hypothetical protein